MHPSFDDLVAQANAEGFFLLNCFQHPSKGWQVNLQRRVQQDNAEILYSEFAQNAVLSAALADCLDKIRTAKPTWQLGIGRLGNYEHSGEAPDRIRDFSAAPTAALPPSGPIPRVRPVQASPAPAKPATNAIPRVRPQPSPAQEPPKQGFFE